MSALEAFNVFHLNVSTLPRVLDFVSGYRQSQTSIQSKQPSIHPSTQPSIPTNIGRYTSVCDRPYWLVFGLKAKTLLMPLLRCHCTKPIKCNWISYYFSADTTDGDQARRLADWLAIRISAVCWHIKYQTRVDGQDLCLEISKANKTQYRINWIDIFGNSWELCQFDVIFG